MDLLAGGVGVVVVTEGGGVEEVECGASFELEEALVVVGAVDFDELFLGEGYGVVDG